jgi:hypothetical protein
MIMFIIIITPRTHPWCIINTPSTMIFIINYHHHWSNLKNLIRVRAASVALRINITRRINTTMEAVMDLAILIINYNYILYMSHHSN